ncbi:MAG: DNA-binding protein [Rhodococcus sp.]|nr:DNA-binding protein [Rhodococcus sp. (in: high G+C Gram-positive bacteria)]
MDALEDRYVAGELDFEDAASEALGTPIDRREMASVLHCLRMQSHPTAQISNADAELYDDAGFQKDPTAVIGALLTREGAMAALTSSALTVGEAAERLGVGASRIRQRAVERSMWAIKVGHKLVLPAVQFTQNGMVDGLGTVIAKIPAQARPLAVNGLLTEPSDLLTVDGARVSIVQWLSTGGDLNTALEVVEAFTWEGN